MLSFIKLIWSYVLGVKLYEYSSEVSGKLELWLIDGKKVLNSANANYSFDSLHRVFQKSFQAVELENHLPKHVLILGFGCGSVAHILRQEYGFDCHITGVDLDPLMFKIAEEHFDIHPSEKLVFIQQDAQLFITKNTAQYDLIVVDLFVDDEVPENFTSSDFIHVLIQALTSDGRIFINLITSHQLGRNQLHKIQEALGNSSQLLKPNDTNTVLYYRK